MKLSLAFLFAFGESLECNTVCDDRSAYPSNATLTAQDCHTCTKCVEWVNADLSETGALNTTYLDNVMMIKDVRFTDPRARDTKDKLKKMKCRDKCGQQDCATKCNNAPKCSWFLHVDTGSKQLCSFFRKGRNGKPNIKQENNVSPKYASYQWTAFVKTELNDAQKSVVKQRMTRHGHPGYVARCEATYEFPYDMRGDCSNSGDDRCPFGYDFNDQGLKIRKAGTDLCQCRSIEQLILCQNKNEQKNDVLIDESDLDEDDDEFDDDEGLDLSNAHLNKYNCPPGSLNDIEWTKSSACELVRRTGLKMQACERATYDIRAIKWDHIKDDQGITLIPYYFSKRSGVRNARAKYGAWKKKILASIEWMNWAFNEYNTGIALVPRDDIEGAAGIPFKRNCPDKEFGKSCFRKFLTFQLADTCSARLGQQKTVKKNTIKLSTNCMDDPIAVQHEFMHALGFWHEHQRPDTPEYITVHFDRLAPGAESQFELFLPENIGNKGAPFDITSIMCYDPTEATYGDHTVVSELTEKGIQLLMDKFAEYGEDLTYEQAKTETIWKPQAILDEMNGDGFSIQDLEQIKGMFDEEYQKQINGQ